MDGSSGSYRMDCIGIDIGFARINGFYALAGFLLSGWDGWTGWDVGGMEGQTLAGAGTGAPPLALEGRRVV